MKERWIDCSEAMIAAVRQLGVVPLFRCGVHGWSIEEQTAPGFWFTEGDELGPWDWKVEVVREGDIAYGKFLGGKAAFATREWYALLCDARRSLPRYRMALGEPFPAKTKYEQEMQRLSPMALQAIRAQGSCNTGELRAACGGVKKNVIDSVLQYLQMGTWCLTGDITRVYRGPDLHYNGWQKASYTTPEALFGTAQGEVSGPSWAKRFEQEAQRPKRAQLSPEAARSAIIDHILEIVPAAERRAVEKMI